ncbi:MAG: hypothetical protein ACO1HP_08680, partial [Bacteroidota bacterium]
MKPFPVFLFLITTILSISNSIGANLTWTGNNSSNWGDSTNWNPSGIPGQNDTANIYSGTFNPQLNSNTSLYRLNLYSGTIDLNGYLLTISANANYSGGQLSNGQLKHYGTGTITIAGTTFNAKVHITANSILLNGATFNDSLTIVKKGTSPDNSKGGNFFNYPVSLTDSASGNIILSDSLPDSFGSTLEIANRSSGKVYIAHRGVGNVFQGDVTFNGSKIYSNYYGSASFNGNIYLNTPAGEVYFGVSTGTANLASGKSIAIIGTGISAGSLSIKNFSQLGASPAISLTLTGSAKVILGSGNSFNAPVSITAPTVQLEKTRFLNVVNITHTGVANAVSNGGCYFGGRTIIQHNPSTSCTFSLGNAYVDTFSAPAAIINNSGLIIVGQATFYDSVSFKNNNSLTSSDRYYVSNAGDVICKGVTTIESTTSGFNIGNGTGYLRIDSTAQFVISNTSTGNIKFRNLLLSGNLSANISLPGYPSKLICSTGFETERPFTFSGQSILLNGGKYRSPVNIVRYGSYSDVSTGGNNFYAETTITDSSSHANTFTLCNANVDTFFANVSFRQIGAGVRILPAYQYTTVFHNSLSFTGTDTLFIGNGTGQAILMGGDPTGQIVNASIGNNPGQKPVSFRKLIIGKLSDPQFPPVNVNITSPILIKDSLIFSTGVLKSSLASGIVISDNAKAIGGSDLSFANAFVTKLGNDPFTYPLGDIALPHAYHPLSISAPSGVGSNVKAALTVTNPTGSFLPDSLTENVNECFGWYLESSTDTAGVSITSYWNNEQCRVYAPAKMRVSQWNGAFWESRGGSSSTGDSLLGSITTGTSVNPNGYFRLSNQICYSLQSLELVDHPTCIQAEDGAIEVKPDNGAAPFSILWLNPKNDNFQIESLASGVYHYTFTDARGCAYSDTIQLVAPASIQLDYSSTKSDCGDSSGAILGTASGGTAPFEWSLSKKTGEFESLVISNSANSYDLPAGIYQLSVFDLNGCIATREIALADTAGPTISIKQLQHVTCYNGSSGSIEIETVSSYPPCTINWLGRIDTTFKLQHLQAGDYSCLVSDSIGCSTEFRSTILQPDSIFASTTSSTASACNGSTGALSITVTGGKAPYHYLFNDSTYTSSTFSNLPAGSDSIIILDDNNCAAIYPFLIRDSSTVAVAISTLQLPTCFQEFNGTVHASGSGGTPPYQFFWTAIGSDSVLSFSDTLDSIPSGLYTCMIKDAQGCKGYSDHELTGPNPLVVNIAFGACTDTTNPDGYCMALAFGGSEVGYQFAWSTGDSTATITNLPPDTYTVVVTDAYGCTASGERRIPVNLNSCDIRNYEFLPCAIGITVNCPQPCSTIYKDIVVDFGADGNDNLSDQCAFETAAVFFQNALSTCGCPGTLYIPEGTYYVGREEQSGGYLFRGSSVLAFYDIDNLTIIGKVVNGQLVSKIKFEDCMRYGVFDPVTLDRHLGPFPCTYIVGSDTISCYQCGVNLYDKCAFPGNMLAFQNCTNISLKNIELDGNLDNAIIGGNYCDGIQLDYDGVFLDNCTNVLVENVASHHFGRDGIQILARPCPTLLPHPLFRNMNIRLSSSSFNFNGRNGLSWTGGSDVSAVNCTFNFNAMGRIASKPGVGVDIEYETAGGIRGGHFEDCQFLHNRNAGFICDAFSGGNHYLNFNHEFVNCIFKSSYDSYSVWPNTRSLKFNRCTFFGQLVSGYNSPIASPSTGTNDFLQFEGSRFYEEDGLYNYSRGSTDQCLTGCTGDLSFLIDFYNVSRGTFNNCVFSTNKFMRIGRGGGGYLA